MLMIGSTGFVLGFEGKLGLTSVELPVPEHQAIGIAAPTHALKAIRSAWDKVEMIPMRVDESLDRST